jgi:hypothetical protein
MNKHSIATFTVLLCSLGWATHVTAQTKDETKLDAFQRKVGAVLAKGSSLIGTVNGGAGTSIHVRAIEYLDMSSGARESGIEFLIGGDEVMSAQIDYDEIDPLVNALQRLATLDKNVTGLEKYEAIYHARGNLAVSLIEAPIMQKGLSAVISGNQIRGKIVILTVETLGELKRLLNEAKSKLDSLKPPAK